MSEQSASGSEQFSSLIMSESFVAEATELGPSLTETTPDRARSSERRKEINGDTEKTSIGVF